MPLISIPYISRILDPAGVGKVGFIDSFTYYFITVAEFGIAVYGSREVVKLRDNREQLQKLVAELLVLHLISSAITLILYSITVFFTWSRINDIRLLLFSVSFLLVNSFACEWYFLGTERFKYITIRTLITRLLGLASIFILIKMPADYYLYYGIMVAAACGNGIWNIISLLRELPLSITQINWKKHIRYTRVTYAISLLYSITIMLDIVFLRFTSTVIAVGFYSFTMRIVRISQLLLSDSLLVFFPRIVSYLKDKKTVQLQTAILDSVQLIVFFGVPLSAGLFLLSDELVHFYLGDSFVRVASGLKIVAAFPLLKSVSLFISRQVLISHDKEKIYVNILIVGCIFLFITMPLLSFFFADTGACYAIMLTELLILILNYQYARKLINNIKIFDFTGLLHACIAALTFIPVVYLLKKYAANEVTLLLATIITCFIFYMTVQLFVLRGSFARSLQAFLQQHFLRKKNSNW